MNLDPVWLTIAAVGIGAWLVLRRANELCAVELSPEGARLVRGRAPARFLADASEVARRAAIHGGVVRVVVESGEPRLLPSPDIPELVVQQLRNVAGQHRVVHFRTGRRPA